MFVTLLLSSILLPQGAREAGSVTWKDHDADGRMDVLAVTPAGGLRLLRNAGDGTFDDVTEEAGLAGVRRARFALWEDFDGDERLDLFVGAMDGRQSRLFHDRGDGVLEDVTATCNLGVRGAPLSARWLDYDGDGRLDLHVEDTEGHRIHRALGGGLFEWVDLELPQPGNATFGTFQSAREARGLDRRELPIPPADEREPRGRPSRRVPPDLSLIGHPDPGQALSWALDSPGSTTSGSLGAVAPLAFTCAPALEDVATGACVSASSIPMLGALYPLGPEFNIDGAGNVGIGTTTPGARLEVAGTVRMTDTLTLAPSGDQALDLASGGIYKGGALFLHEKAGSGSTAVGSRALANNVGAGFDGVSNTAMGYYALVSNTTGSGNTALGYQALRNNTTNSRNTAVGASALRANTGWRDTAIGDNALRNNTTGNGNVSIGSNTLYRNTVGFYNTAVGTDALRNNQASDLNTAVGSVSLLNNNGGHGNSALGHGALRGNTTGSYNTACGWKALYSSTTGWFNVGLGINAGMDLTTGSNNICIGHRGFPADDDTIRIGNAPNHTRVFVAGIRGATTGIADAVPVLVDSDGQLGTISSSRRFKEEIEDMGALTERLLELRPVTFRFSPEVQAGARPLEYGLIAEEVAAVFPDLVVYDEDGEPFTVKYHLLSSMLLNELKRLQSEKDAEVVALRKRVEALEGLQPVVRDLEGRVAALAASRFGGGASD